MLGLSVWCAAWRWGRRTSGVGWRFLRVWRLEEEMMMLDGGGDCSRRTSARAKPRPEDPPVMRMLVLASLEVYFD